MAFELFSSTPDLFEAQLKAASSKLLYLSETDAPLQVYRFSMEKVGTTFSKTDLYRYFYPEGGKVQALGYQSSSMERYYSPGFRKFFRHSIERIVQEGRGLYIPDPNYQDELPDWRALRDLILDHMVHQRFYRVETSEPAQKDLYIVGQHLQIEADRDTYEARNIPGDWFVLYTYAIET